MRKTALVAGCSLLFHGCSGTGELSANERQEAPAAQNDEEKNAAASNAATASASQMQRAVMDFSDHYVSALWLAFDEYIKTETDLTRRVNAQKWKVMLGATSMTIAGSRDPRAALLDMAVFISAGKWAVDRHWIPGVFGENAAPLRMVYKEMDRRIWGEVAKLLTPAQQSDLRGLIAAWEATDPPRNQLLDVRLRNLDGVVLSDFAEVRSSRGLLASIQRLLGRVDQSLLYGERMIFYMERVPRMLAQQSDLTIDRVAERFPIATVNPDFGSLSAMAEDIPRRISDALQDQEGIANKTLPEIRASIESVERLTFSLQQTLDSANLLSGQIQKLPFGREDYAFALRETSTALTQINGIVEGLNQLVAREPDATRLVQTLDDQADILLNKAFYRGLVLIGVFFAGVLLSLLAARVIFRRRGENVTLPSA